MVRTCQPRSAASQLVRVVKACPLPVRQIRYCRVRTWPDDRNTSRTGSMPWLRTKRYGTERRGIRAQRIGRVSRVLPWVDRRCGGSSHGWSGIWSRSARSCGLIRWRRAAAIALLRASSCRQAWFPFGLEARCWGRTPAGMAPPSREMIPLDEGPELGEGQDATSLTFPAPCRHVALPSGGRSCV